jgi:hypothetical protein
MTGHTKMSHSVSLATPLIVATAFVVGALFLGVAVIEPILINDPYASPLAAMLGEGVDEFSLRAGSILGTAVPSDAQGWIASVAVFVTVWSVIRVIRQLRGPVGGSGDIGALTGYTIRHTMVSLGLRESATAWGTVRDSRGGGPLPLATVRLVGSDGTVMDVSTADHHGRYGFRMPYESIILRGYRARLETRKSGYYPAGGSSGLPVLAGAYNGLDVAMDRARGFVSVASRPAGPLGRIAGTSAFWAGVLGGPFNSVSAPSLSSMLLLGAFLGAALIRAVWLRHPQS